METYCQVNINKIRIITMLNNKYVICLLFSGILSLLSGCQSSNTIYYWGDYQKALYDYTQTDKSDYIEQVQKLEKTIEKAKSSNKPVPPGLHAHLGLLYATSGNKIKALEQFEIEKSLFPESKTFIDFIEKNIKEINQ
jgi:hypothetical protein